MAFDFDFTNRAWATSFLEFSNTVSEVVRSTPVVFVAADVPERTNRLLVHRRGLLPQLLDLVTPTNKLCSIGLATLNADPSQVVRAYQYTNMFGHDPLAFVVAQHLDPYSAERASFILNYYGPPGTVPHYGAAEVTSAPTGEPSTLTGKAVFVGAPRGDTHPTPFTRHADDASTGVEIHATACANLAAKTYIRDVPKLGEQWFVVLLAGVMGCGFVQLPPRCALVCGGAGALIVTLVSYGLFTFALTFIPWLTIVAVMLPLAYGVSFLPVKSAFISYRTADKEPATHLAEGLRSRGIAIYFDRTAARAGHLQDGLLPEVERRRNFVLLVTPALWRPPEATPEPKPCDWVFEEIARARQTNKAIVLVEVEDVRKQIPYSNLPAYKAVHTNSEFTLAAVLDGEFRALYHVDQLDASVKHIAAMLHWTFGKTG